MLTLGESYVTLRVSAGREAPASRLKTLLDLQLVSLVTRTLTLEGGEKPVFFQAQDGGRTWLWGTEAELVASSGQQGRS